MSNAKTDQGANASLRELTSDWFLFLVTYRRNVRSMPADIDWVRSKLMSMLADMDAAVRQDRSLEFLVGEAKYPLVYFADEVLLNCRWAGEAAWASQLLEVEVFNTRHGGRDFFDRLKDPNLDPQLLDIYYRCLCLGFRGVHTNQSLPLREERDRLYRRLAPREIPTPRFCPEAYENTEERDHIRPPIMATAITAVLAGVFMVTIYFVSRAVFQGEIDGLVTQADQIVEGR